MLEAAPLEAKALLPTATLLAPVVLFTIAALPTATLLEPVVFAFNAGPLSTALVPPKALLLIPIGLMLITACRKEQGCTDINATNYSETAKDDDGSCSFSGENVIWYGKATSTGLIGDGATTLTFYVDGQIVGSTAASVYWTASPDCGENASITITKDLGIAKNKSYSYSVKDQTGFEYWKGTLNFTANTCEALEIVW